MGDTSAAVPAMQPAPHNFVTAQNAL
jgi:hypothetical protein